VGRALFVAVFHVSFAMPPAGVSAADPQTIGNRGTRFAVKTDE
jgi:hypothetical protein